MWIYTFITVIFSHKNSLINIPPWFFPFKFWKVTCKSAKYVFFAFVVYFQRKKMFWLLNRNSYFFSILLLFNQQNWCIPTFGQIWERTRMNACVWEREWESACLSVREREWESACLSACILTKYGLNGFAFFEDFDTIVEKCALHLKQTFNYQTFGLLETMHFE